MTSSDFEKYWRAQFASSIEAVAGSRVREQIMGKSELPLSGPDRSGDIQWTVHAMQRLEHLLDREACIDIMTRCSCQYPKGELQDAKIAYKETGDITEAHQILQKKFILFLRRTLGLEDDIIDTIVTRGWGLAGVLKDDAIIATKIPKSGFLREYLAERDPDKKRALYCHCPRVRSILAARDAVLSPTYCYCGGGFYKGIWEEILGRDVRVELHKTVMQGHDVCQFKVVF
ncbi:MAG: hypothetical protein JSW02_06650 [candidate division WOR-3 bacterium]|nr:MAG: hypothetical protein JSW02_06650 [candidate division WOR-3 bacterium]